MEKMRYRCDDHPSQFFFFLNGRSSSDNGRQIFRFWKRKCRVRTLTKSSFRRLRLRTHLSFSLGVIISLQASSQEC